MSKTTRRPTLADFNSIVATFEGLPEPGRRRLHVMLKKTLLAFGFDRHETANPPPSLSRDYFANIVNAADRLLKLLFDPAGNLPEAATIGDFHEAPPAVHGALIRALPRARATLRMAARKAGRMNSPAVLRVHSREHESYEPPAPAVAYIGNPDVRRYYENDARLNAAIRYLRLIRESANVASKKSAKAVKAGRGGFRNVGKVIQSNLLFRLFDNYAHLNKLYPAAAPPQGISHHPFKGTHYGRPLAFVKACLAVLAKIRHPAFGEVSDNVIRAAWTRWSNQRPKKL